MSWDRETTKCFDHLYAHKKLFNKSKGLFHTLSAAGQNSDLDIWVALSFDIPLKHFQQFHLSTIMNGVGNGLMWGRSCGVNYRLWPSSDSSLLNISVLRCQTHKLFFGILDWLPTFSHLSSVSFPLSKLPLLFPPPISLLIIPSISFSTQLLFLLSCPTVHSLSVVIHLSWLRQLLPMWSCGHFQDFSKSMLLLAQNKKLKQVMPGGCWTESRMNDPLLECRASLHKAFAAPKCKGKSIPIKSINSLLSGNNKDFY